MKLKRDRFRSARGGYSRLLEISCSKCKRPLLLYQKDGPGPLIRLYKDRVFSKIPDTKNLSCSKCKESIGVSIIYEKENRPAFLLKEGSILKRIKKIT